jgi:hypothetical protein
MLLKLGAPRVLTPPEQQQLRVASASIRVWRDSEKVAEKRTSPGIILPYVGREHMARRCDCTQVDGVKVRGEMREKLRGELDEVGSMMGGRR